MAQTLTGLVLKDARSIIADRRLRLRGAEAVDRTVAIATHVETRPSGSAPSARLFAQLTKSQATVKLRTALDGKWPVRLQWLPACVPLTRTSPVGASLCSPMRGGQAAVLRAIDTLVGYRRA
jgi:hypothetical protein